MKGQHDPYFFLTTESLTVELRSYHRKIVFRDECSIYNMKKLVELFNILLLKYGVDIREIAKGIDLRKEIQEMKEYKCVNCGCKIQLNEDMINEEKEIPCPKCGDSFPNPFRKKVKHGA